jgi:hypothetical protein
MSYESNPVWSFGKKLLPFKDKLVVPGPGMYNPDENVRNAVKTRITNCPMSRAKRCGSLERPEVQNQPRQVVSAYLTEKLSSGQDSNSKAQQESLKSKTSHLDRPRRLLGGKFGMATRFQHQKVLKTEPLVMPGPTEYSPMKLTKKVSAWQIGNEIRHGPTPQIRAANEAPGPGKYHPDLDYMKRKLKTYSFTQQTRLGVDDCTSDMRDTNIYHTCESPKSGYAGPFGKSQRKHVKNDSSCDEDVGPGVYDICYEDISYRNQRGKGWTMLSRKKDLLETPDFVVPGAGSYDPQTNKRSSPQISVPKQKRLGLTAGGLSIPGPGAYHDYCISTKASSPKFTKQGFNGIFNHATRSCEIAPKLRRPPIGPGHYQDVKPQRIRSPKYQFSYSKNGPLNGNSDSNFSL